MTLGLRLIALAVLLSCHSRAEPSIVKVSGRQLLLQRRAADGTLSAAAPYIMRGLNWSPASTNTLTTPTDPDNVNRRRPEFAKWHRTDLPLIQSLNANTVRVPMDFGIGAESASGRAVLDACQAAGVMVVMTIDNGINDTNRIREVIATYRDHPAILLWSLGNEWNINRYYGVASSVLEAAQRTETAAAWIKRLDPNHPVVSSYGEIDINVPGLRLADTARYVNEICRSVDIWALNIYRGKSFGSLFAQWAGITSKPMFLGEFGIDAFHSSTPTNPNPPGAINEAEQAEWDVALWQNLARNLSARDPNNVAVGGLVHEFNDQWWKIAPATSQQTGGLISANGFPDGMSSEEIFGICDIFRKPRAAYEALRVAFNDAAPPPGKTLSVSSAGNSGAGSLRQAVADAQPGDTISFAISGTITLGSEIRIEKDLVIAGPGTNRITLSGNNATRLFNISTGVLARISGVTFTRGSAAETGGCIFNRGALELTDCRFVNNFAGSGGDGVGHGGAINSTGAVVIERCTFTDNRGTGNGGAIRSTGELSVRDSFFGANRANYYGGAIYNFDSGTIASSVLTNNFAGASGGGIWNENSGLSVIGSTLARNSAQQGGGLANKNGSVLLANSTLSLNTAAIGGGGIFNGVFNENGGTMVLANSTIASNTASGSLQGGGIRIGTGAVTVRSCILAGNSPTDCTGAVVSEGFNLLGNQTGSSGIANGANQDQAGTASAKLDPFLGPLRDNTGPSPTHALASGSPALDRGNSFGRDTDQRGEPRFDHPAVPNAPGSDGTDIGAYEASQPRFLSATQEQQTFRIEFTTLLGRELILEHILGLTGLGWIETARIAGTGGKVETNLPISAGTRFFRLYFL